METLGIYLLFLLAASLVVVGWFMVTRGELKEKVDGTFEKDGSLLREWEIFWYKKKEPNRVLFTGKHLFNKMKEVRAAAIQLGCAGNFDVQHDHLVATSDIKSKIKFIEYITENEIKTEEESPSLTRLFVYKLEDNFVFPERIRVPLAGCVTCYASIYGSIVFWGTQFIFKLFDYEGLRLILVWVAFTFSMAVLNTFIYKQIK